MFMLFADFTCDALTTAKTRQKSTYIEFVSKGESKEIERFYSLKNLPLILGDKPFIEVIREKFSDVLNQLEIPEARRWPLMSQGR